MTGTGEKILRLRLRMTMVARNDRWRVRREDSSASPQNDNGGTQNDRVRALGMTRVGAEDKPGGEYEQTVK
ncbi:MAG: hypothetical protein DBX49_01235 [Clostridia bacterium]|nr:MAG: hypothetical protein DBX49_01235 [Clostridia bacterium]